MICWPACEACFSHDPIGRKIKKQAAGQQHNHARAYAGIENTKLLCGAQVATSGIYLTDGRSTEKAVVRLISTHPAAIPIQIELDFGSNHSFRPSHFSWDYLIYLQFDDIWFSSLIHRFLQVDPRQYLI
jgi:hypothetical protein